MTQTDGLDAFTEFSRPAVIAVGVPMMILAGIATYFNSRASVARQSPEAAANPQTAMMNKLALYVFPLGVVVGGPFLPLAIIMYWLANNIWTFGQQHYVFGKIEKEEEAKKQQVLERRSANAPAPGAKPVKGRKAARWSASTAADGCRDGGGRRRPARRPRSNGAETESSSGATLDGEPIRRLRAAPRRAGKQTQARRQTKETQAVTPVAGSGDRISDEQEAAQRKQRND